MTVVTDRRNQRATRDAMSSSGYALPLRVAGVGICAPGLVDWPQARSVLSGRETHHPQPLARLLAESLPATERRRANGMANLALHAAEEAVRHLPRHAIAELSTVFSSAHGDGIVLGQLLHALAQPSVAVSPTLFHNSVFNAPAGYWSIASGSQAASTTLCAGSASFAAGFIEAYAQVRVHGRAVLYVAVDVSFPQSLDEFDLKHQPLACALLLSPMDDRAAGFGAITGWTISPHADSPVDESDAEIFFAGNSAAQAIRLLSAMARRSRREIRLPYIDNAWLELAYKP